MSFKRMICSAMLGVLAMGLGSQLMAQPIFENRTPTGFSVSDSVSKTNFVTGKEVTVQVDLNEAANFDYPVIGNFQKMERSVPFFTTPATAGYMDQALEVDGNGVIHRAWIQQRGTVDLALAGSTPVYGVVYAKSLDGGKTFMDTISVSGSLRFDMITPNVSLTSAFSTLDLVVDSKGNPRVVYAMNFSADGIMSPMESDGAGARTTDERVDSRGVRNHNNIFFNYSNDGGSSWLPANSAIVINDTSTVNNTAVGNFPGRNTAFPRMAVTETDDIFIVYERSLHMSHHGNAPGATDIMLAKMDGDSLKTGSATQVLIGANGTVGSSGGILIDTDDQINRSPDIAVGDDDVLHIVWYSNRRDEIHHKQLPASRWDDRSQLGWNPGANGSDVATFDDEPAENLGIIRAGNVDDVMVRPANSGLVRLFPTVAVDKSMQPDRIYTFWKHTDAAAYVAFAAGGEDENIAYAVSNYNGLPGAGATWGTRSFAFPEGTLTDVTTTTPLFQASTNYVIESHWIYVDRVAVLIDPRKTASTNGADIHIAFSGGRSVSETNLGGGETGTAAGSAERLNNGIPEANTSIYYTRFNGTEWELPQVVASQSNGSSDGFLPSRKRAAGNQTAAMRAHQQVFAPRIAMRDGDDNVYLTFVGGSATRGPVNLRGVRTLTGAGGTLQGDVQPGRGYATNKPGNISPLPYFKVIGREVTFDDVSIPNGAYVYRMNYTPVNPPVFSGNVTSLPKRMVQVTAAGNTDGTGIGWQMSGGTAARGGFLTGQWRRIHHVSLGVASLTPGTPGAVFKGALSQNQAQNNRGAWEGQVNDDGSAGFGEWGDDGDKNGLLVKLNVLGGDSSTNLFVVASTSAAVLSTRSAGLSAASQNVGLAGLFTAFGSMTTPSSSIVQGIEMNGHARAELGMLNPRFYTAATQSRFIPLGSFFQMGANINIVAANVAPVVDIVEPNATTADNGAFSSETFAIRYVLFDEDTDVGDQSGPVSPNHQMITKLYYYPDNGLSSVRDIATFGTMIVDENDAYTSVTRAPVPGTGDFVEGTSPNSVQNYSWDDPGNRLQSSYNFAPINKARDGLYYIYIVADDRSNPPVFAVSDGPVRIRHIPVVRSVSPVVVDTVDTGEYDDLDKTNPFVVKFDLVDYNDNAQVRLFYSTSGALTASDVAITGTYPNLSIDLAGATAMVLSDSLRTDEDVEFSFDVTAQGSAGDSVIAQASYTLYAVVADGDSFAVGASSFPLSVRHSPAFEFTAPLKGIVKKINTTQQFNYTIEWQRGRSDKDLDDNASIGLYYTGVDPVTFDYSGIDSTRLVATTGANAGNAVLIQGGLREDDEGAGDQFVWDFKAPPGALPRVFKQPFTIDDGAGAFAPQYREHAYQHGAVTDTAWIYAVLKDERGNSRVQAGGAVLLLGSQETPASQAPRVVMRTPPAGDQLLINGDVVKLEWDAFLIDDGTGTDDAYLRLYAAPKGKYSTMTQLETHMRGQSGADDVILINSITGTDTTLTHVTNLRESGENSFNWDTKTTSFAISGTPIEYDVFIAGSMDPFTTHGAAPVYVNGQVDSVASGLGSRSQVAVLSKSPGALRIEGTDPLYSIELSPSSLVASSGDTLEIQLLANSQGTSVDQMAYHLNVPRNHFTVLDVDDNAANGFQVFQDSNGAFQTPSTIAQNDTTTGDAQWLKLNFVEFSLQGELVGRVASPFDSSQVVASFKLLVNNYSGGAPLDTVLQWSVEPGRKAAFYRGTSEIAAPAREGKVILTPRARLIVTVPLEGRSDYTDVMDAHLRLIGSTQDITDQDYIAANDISPVFSGDPDSTLEDSVNVNTDAFGTFTLTQIPSGVYEITVKAPGYITGRSDTLTLFNGLTQAISPTFGTDALGDLSPATPLGALRGGDATNDNQVDIADANLIFSVWNETTSDPGYVRDADVNNDGVVNSIDLGFVTKNFGNDGFGAPPVFKMITSGGDNTSAIAKIEGIEEVEAWWPGRVFEVTARLEDMTDVAAFGLQLTYDPEKVKPLAADQAISQGDVFDGNGAGSLFFHRFETGVVEVASGRIGSDWSASGDGDLATVRFMALVDEPGVIEIANGVVVNSAHFGIPMTVDKAPALPSVAALHQNYPNPFNPATEIRFDIPTARDVQLRIYNQLGQTVRTLVDNRMKAGTYALEWDGQDQMGRSVASGVYFYNLEAGDFNQIRKMTLVK